MKIINTTWEEAIKKIAEVAGLPNSTQNELAAELGVPQSRISDAKRRGVLPDNWLIILLIKYNANPRYILGVSNRKNLKEMI